METDHIAALRRFNRSFTPRIGVLDESFLGTGRPLAAARLLFDIGLGAGNVGVFELRRRLGADSGYFSRLLRSLEDDGLIMMHADPDDGRRRIPGLTAVGERAWHDLDRRSNELAHGVLEPLSSAQRSELMTALAVADRLLRLSTISMMVVDPASQRARDAMQEYFDELGARFTNGFDVGDDYDAELARMAAPDGAFVVVDDDGTTSGCGGLQRIDDQTVEVKRMWLCPSLRGLGLGKRLLAQLETLAQELGYDTVVLDTNAVLVEAIAMYESVGYESIERYNTNPYAQRWFRKTLPSHAP